MTTETLRRINSLAVLLEKFSRYADRADEGKELFEKSVVEIIQTLNLEIK